MKCPRCGKEIESLPCDECGFPMNQKKLRKIIRGNVKKQSKNFLINWN